VGTVHPVLDFQHAAHSHVRGLGHFVPILLLLRPRRPVHLLNRTPCFPAFPPVFFQPLFCECAGRSHRFEMPVFLARQGLFSLVCSVLAVVCTGIAPAKLSQRAAACRVAHRSRSQGYFFFFPNLTSHDTLLHAQTHTCLSQLCVGMGAIPCEPWQRRRRAWQQQLMLTRCPQLAGVAAQQRVCCLPAVAPTPSSPPPHYECVTTTSATSILLL
jgi:hypothetical protein